MLSANLVQSATPPVLETTAFCSVLITPPYPVDSGVLLIHTIGKVLAMMITMFSPYLQARRIFLVLLSTVVLTACGDSGDGSRRDNIMEDLNASPLMGCADSNSCVSNPPLVLDAERPAQVQIPVDYDVNTRYPLVIVLHGLGANGRIQSLYFGLVDRVDSEQFILVAPDGKVNSQGRNFWNANEVCCATSPEDREVDDAGYIRGLIEEAAATYSIDPGRVGLIGHSNGGFMSLRLACDTSELVTSVVSLAGATYNDAAQCAPATNPVSVLLLHGTADDTVFYEGIPGAYPSALEAAQRFAELAECDMENPTMPANQDLVTSLPGPETEVLSYQSCAPGVDVELRTLVDGPHIPGPWEPAGLDSMLDWLLSHDRQEWR